MLDYGIALHGLLSLTSHNIPPAGWGGGFSPTSPPISKNSKFEERFLVALRWLYNAEISSLRGCVAMLSSFRCLYRWHAVVCLRIALNSFCLNKKNFERLRVGV